MWSQKLLVGTSQAAAIYRTAKNSTLKFPFGFPFKTLLCSLAKKVSKMHLLCKKTRCFIHYPLFFATLSLIISLQHIKPLSANPTKWSNTLKQFSGNFPTNCLSVFDHFVGLMFKGLSFALVCLAKVYEHSVLPNVMKDPLLIVRVILRKPSVQTLILSRVRR